MSGFPQDFVWGCATAAYQIEGAPLEDGKGPSIWDTFAHEPGRIRNGDTGDVACDHYHRWAEDVKMIAGMGHNGYRFSISWPRVLPDGRGQVNERGVDFYSRLVDGLLEAGVAPFATLYHWDLPQALQDRGGWPNRDTAQYFAEYAALMFDRLGDRCPNWITLNEPYVVAELGHLQGIFAPGMQSVEACLACAHHLNLASALGVQAFRASGRAGQIGLTCNLTPMEPLTDSPEDAAATALYDQWINGWWLEPTCRGHYPQQLVEGLAEQMPDIRDGDLELIAEPLDFFGLNYYRRQMVAHDPGYFLNSRVEEGPGTRTDMNWEVHPTSYYDMLSRMVKEYGISSIYLTENGAFYLDTVGPDGEVHDPQRIAYLEQHLAQVERALDDGLPIHGYFLWSLMDNFEWASGFSIRMGIVYTDYPTQRRLPKDSARWYSQVIRNRALPA
ncbi:MAG TPA: GH1 family beta-glucosidase [Armatimonadota bacterium]|jgi:beta-glucosidase